MDVSLPIPQKDENDFNRLIWGFTNFLEVFIKEELIPKSDSWSFWMKLKFSFFFCKVFPFKFDSLRFYVHWNMRVECTKNIDLWKNSNLIVIHFKSRRLSFGRAQIYLAIHFKWIKLSFGRSPNILVIHFTRFKSTEKENKKNWYIFIYRLSFKKPWPKGKHIKAPLSINLWRCGL